VAHCAEVLLLQCHLAQGAVLQLLQHDTCCRAQRAVLQLAQHHVAHVPSCRPTDATVQLLQYHLARALLVLPDQLARPELPQLDCLTVTILPRCGFRLLAARLSAGRHASVMGIRALPAMRRNHNTMDCLITL
jgi:hypothetical protein